MAELTQYIQEQIQQARLAPQLAQEVMLIAQQVERQGIQVIPQLPVSGAAMDTFQHLVQGRGMPPPASRPNLVSPPAPLPTRNLVDTTGTGCATGTCGAPPGMGNPSASPWEQLVNQPRQQKPEPSSSLHWRANEMVQQWPVNDVLERPMIIEGEPASTARLLERIMPNEPRIAGQQWSGFYGASSVRLDSRGPHPGPPLQPDQKSEKFGLDLGGWTRNGPDQTVYVGNWGGYKLDGTLCITDENGEALPSIEIRHTEKWKLISAQLTARQEEGFSGEVSIGGIRVKVVAGRYYVLTLHLTYALLGVTYMTKFCPPYWGETEAVMVRAYYYFKQDIPILDISKVLAHLGSAKVPMLGTIQASDMSEFNETVPLTERPFSQRFPGQFSESIGGKSYSYEELVRERFGDVPTESETMPDSVLRNFLSGMSGHADFSSLVRSQLTNVPNDGCWGP